jgi:hypothetical protein
MTDKFRIQKPWPPFVHGEKIFDLSHLNERMDYVVDSKKKKRIVLVTFTDHCFTRLPNGSADAAPRYPGCSRMDGRFCTDRYELSLKLNHHINFSNLREVWNTVGDEHYAIVRGVDHRGTRVEYAVIFSLEKLKGVQAEGGTKVDLHMRIRTAHKRNNKPIETFGSVRFSHLVKLVMENERPLKIYDHKRKRPKIT